MGGQYHWIDVSREEIIQAIDNPAGKVLTAAIFDAFIANGLTYKVRAQAKSKKSSARDGYTIYFYIKKSKESIIINTIYYKMQLRINDRSTFEKLDDYSENVRKAILIDSVRSPDDDDDNSYVFTYHGTEYRLCYQLYENFKFTTITEEDIDSLMDIINREIIFGNQNNRYRD